MQQPGPDNAFWDDGEWVTWDEINDQIQCQEWRAKYPNADFSLVEVFENLLLTAESYHMQTGRHLQVYGDIGELYGAITHGIKLHRNYAQGSDGRLGNDFVEVKTITPFKTNDTITLDMRRHFSMVLIVKISADFEVRSKLIPRKALSKGANGKLVINWSDFGSDQPQASA